MNGLIEMNTDREKQVTPTPNSTEDISENQPRKTALEETRSFLDNLPQVRKPQTKRSVINEHLAFLDSLPTAPSKVPVEPVSPRAITLEGVRDMPLDVHEGTESPNKRSQTEADSYQRPVQSEESELTEEVMAEIDNVVNA